MHHCKNYFKPKENETVTRHLFHIRKQKEGETIDMHVRDLKKSNFNFGDLKESHIMERVVCGITDNKV